MKPKDFYRYLKNRDFNNYFRPGDLVFTNCHDNFFARLIRIKEKLEGDEGICNHVEMHMWNDIDFSADYKVRFKSMQPFFKGKHDIYVYRNKKLDFEERRKLVHEAIKWLGKPYDILGIVWQVFDTIFRTHMFSRIFNRKLFAYCSELVQRVYWAALKIELGNIGAYSPDDILEFCGKSDDWKFVCIMRKYKKSSWAFYLTDVNNVICDDL